MKTAIATIVLAVMLATSVPVSAAPNDEQSGESLDCLDFMVFWSLPGVESPNAAYVEEVESETGFTIDSEDGDAYVDFFNSDGESVGYGNGEDPVPEDAEYGIVCVAVAGELPAGPAAWTYQDGF